MTGVALAVMLMVSAADPPKEETPTSLIGGRALGHLRVGTSVMLGFPLIELRAGLGLSDRFDVSFGYATYYFLSHEFQALLRFELFEASGFRLMLTALGSGALFVATPQEEQRGARWLTGHRNFNASAGLIGSYQGPLARSARISFSVSYWLGISTQAPEPLLGHNFLVRGMAELPLSNRVAFVLCFGVDVHGRAEDAIVMPMASLGVSFNF